MFLAGDVVRIRPALSVPASLHHCYAVVVRAPRRPGDRVRLVVEGEAVEVLLRVSEVRRVMRALRLDEH